MANRIRKQLEDEGVETGKGKITVMLSGGVADHKAGEAPKQLAIAGLLSDVDHQVAKVLQEDTGT